MQTYNTTFDQTDTDFVSDLVDHARSVMYNGDSMGEAICVALSDYNQPSTLDNYDFIKSEIL
jgi:hypothetical protein